MAEISYYEVFVCDDPFPLSFPPTTKRNACPPRWRRCAEYLGRVRVGFRGDRGGGRRLERRHGGNVARGRRRARAAEPRQSRQRLHACGTACWRPRAIGRCSPMPIFPRPSRNWRSSGAAVKREGAQVAIGSRALDRSLVGVHQPLFREAVGRVFNLPHARGHRTAVSTTRSAASSCSRPTPRAKFSRASNWTGSASTWKFCLSPRTRVSSGGSAGALEQRGRHQGEPAARV